MKVLFVPISVVSGIIAGFAAKKLFEQFWGMIDDQEPPDPKHRDISVPKMVAATAIEGATFRATRALVDQGSRRAFARFTGFWPGKEEPEPE